MTISQKKKCSKCSLYDTDIDICTVDDDCMYKDNGILLDNAPDRYTDK